MTDTYAIKVDFAKIGGAYAVARVRLEGGGS